MVILFCDGLLGKARELGMETAKPSKTLEVKVDIMESDYNKLLSTLEHRRMYRIVVGISVHDSDWRPDVQHAVNRFVCRKVAAPTFIFTRGLTLRMVRTTAEPNVVCSVGNE